MTTWHNRLQDALTARGKEWADLAEITGKTKQSVYKWKPDANKRSNQMDWDNAIKVCKYLKIEHDWLLNGKGPSGLEKNPQQQKFNIRYTQDALAVAELYQLLPPEARVLIRQKITMDAMPLIKENEAIESAVISLFKA